MVENDNTLTHEATSDAQKAVNETFLPLLPLKNVVILPRSINPIIVGRPLSIKAVEYALKNNSTIFVTTQIDAQVEAPTKDDVFEHGTRATILQVMRMPNGALKILAEGLCRARITGFGSQQEFIDVSYEDMPTTNIQDTVNVSAIWRQLEKIYRTYTQFNDKAPADLTAAVKDVHDMDYITDTITMHIDKFGLEERQRILELPDLQNRMLELCTLIKKEISILQAERKIHGRVQTQVEKTQREYYLTEQMKAIQKELGRDDQAAEMDDLKKKIKKLNLPQEAGEKVAKEIQRLEQMPSLSSEAAVSRHYIDWITVLPWHKITKDTISITQAERILDKNHTGLKKTKDRIIEFLAAKKFSAAFDKSPILCLIGPPGVGKTSIAKSIAQSLGREFVRISLGGVRDEAEIRGHRRTYIGSLPGKILHAMKKVQVMNPVILLDEIDKISQDMHGDPASALLEVLDPEQNSTFVDHFLDLEYDLSKVMFIATANVLDSIPYPLLDRLELIHLSGYTDEEKLDITKKFLIPKNLKQHNLAKNQFRISDTLLNHIISEYTKEAGVRQLERVIAKLMRKTIQQLLKDKKISSVTITPELVAEWLGHAPYKKTTLNHTQSRIGLATGLAWTEVGGDILEIETSALPGKGTITLTGQLGDVMQESAQAAFSYIRSRSLDLGLKTTIYSTKDLHLHIPEGATPKDGPSAGITICAALISAFTGNPTRNNLAMSGEITLQGRVLAVGGLKEKLLAAKQHKMTTIIVPQENFEDIQEIKKEINLDSMEIIFARTMDDIIPIAFDKNPFELAKKNKQKGAKKASKAKKQNNIS